MIGAIWNTQTNKAHYHNGCILVGEREVAISPLKTQNWRRGAKGVHENYRWTRLVNTLPRKWPTAHPFQNGVLKSTEWLSFLIEKYVVSASNFL